MLKLPLTTSLVLLGIVVLGVPGDARAAVTTYTDASQFLADLASAGLNPSIEDFDSVSANTSIADGDTIGGITFRNFNLRDGSGLIIDDAFSTTSSANYLGEDFAGNANLITGGSMFDLSFSPQRAIGMSIITGEEPGLSIFDGDIQLNVPDLQEAVKLDVDDVQDVLDDGSLVFFLGLIDDAASFTSSEIRYANEAVDATFYNIDDVTTAADLFRGDFDKDGDVDGADFLIWQENFITLKGATHNDGDADRDGDVDGQDFLIWQKEFPSGLDVGQGANGVPEPTGIGLIIVVAAAVSSLRPAHMRR